MSRKKRSVRPEDVHLFQEVVGDVCPLPQDKVPLRPPAPPPAALQRKRDEAQVLVDMLSDNHDPAELETGEELLHWRPGLQHSVLRRLRRGQIPVEAEFDLHGMTAAVARAALTEFLRECRIHAVRCVRVIHGKGRGSRNRQPVLKAKLNHWLRQRDEVLAFCTARPVDGGTGAVYVLLKRG